MIPDAFFDILVAGEINPDLILSGDVAPEFGQVEKLVENATLTIGSSSAIFACGAARLGLRVAFIGVCGEDVFGRFMLDEMQKRNVDVSNVILRADGQTGLSVILNQDSDRAIFDSPRVDSRCYKLQTSPTSCSNRRGICTLHPISCKRIFSLICRISFAAHIHSGLPLHWIQITIRPNNGLDLTNCFQ